MSEGFEVTPPLPTAELSLTHFTLGEVCSFDASDGPVDQTYTLQPGQYTFLARTYAQVTTADSSWSADLATELVIVPGPATMSLLAIGGLGLLKRKLQTRRSGK